MLFIKPLLTTHGIIVMVHTYGTGSQAQYIFNANTVLLAE